MSVKQKNRIVDRIVAAVRGIVEAMTRRQRRAVQVAFDIGVLALCAWLAFQLRLGFGHDFTDQQIFAVSLAPVIGVPIFIRFGLYRAVLRYIPDMAMWAILQAVALTTLVWVAFLFVLGFYGGGGVPRSIPLIFAVLAFAITVVSRFAAKHVLYWQKAPDRKRYAIFGAGAAGLQYTRGLIDSGEVDVCALFDDDPKLHKNEYHGVRCYPPSMLPDLVRRLGIESVVICMPSVSGQRKLEIAASMAKLPVKVRTLPSLSQLVAGKYRVEPIDRADLNELLGRSPVLPDMRLMQDAVAGKTILVTGAGGSIGSQLVHTLARTGAATIIMVDSSEFALFEVDRKMRALNYMCLLVPVLASVTDREAMQRIFKEHHPHAVFHAAAYKHVALAERNIRSVFTNNVLGTKVLLETAASSTMETFVLISTDKAVNPTSVMGASKRYAELLVRRFAESSDSGKKYVSVRFGNVIGSTGSVIPIFQEQISKGGPVKVRGRNTTRYFMAVSEACELIIQSAGMAEGGETFMLHMGEPVSIYSLARSMIELSGLTVRDAANPDGDIEIIITDMELGEKVSEDLLYDAQSSSTTSHPKIARAKRRTAAHLYIDDAVNVVAGAMGNTGTNELRALLLRTLSECQREESLQRQDNIVRLSPPNR